MLLSTPKLITANEGAWVWQYAHTARVDRAHQ